MTAQISTSRRADLPDGMPTQEQHHRGREWVPTRVTESLALDRRGEWSYRVSASGPVLTVKGNRHATLTAAAAYGSGRFEQPIPEWLEPHLVGPAVLWDEIQAVAATPLA